MGAGFLARRQHRASAHAQPCAFAPAKAPRLWTPKASASSPLSRGRPMVSSISREAERGALKTPARRPPAAPPRGKLVLVDVPTDGALEEGVHRAGVGAHPHPGGED